MHNVIFGLNYERAFKTFLKFHFFNKLLSSFDVGNTLAYIIVKEMDFNIYYQINYTIYSGFLRISE